MHEESEFDIHREWQPDEAASWWARMREADGLCRYSNYGGYYVAARYDDVMKVLMAPEVFGSSKGITLPPPDQIRSYHIPAEVDPPLHKEYRSIVMPMFSAAEARAMEPAMREIARDLIAAIPDEQSIDFVEAFARSLPVNVALHLLGAPHDMAAELEQTVDDLHQEVATGVANGAGRRLESFAHDLLDRRASKDPHGDPDVVTAILHGQVEGRPLTREEQMSMVRLIMVGGFDTTTIALANLARWLAENPDQRGRMAHDAKLIEGLCEEIVRVSSPSTYLRREVMQATELAGAKLEPGDSVLVSFGSANLDPQKFECPAKVAPDRKPNRHVGFGAGRHRCIGSFLAKAQMRITCEELLRNFAWFEVDEDKAIRYCSGLGQGITVLPMRFSRSAR